MSYPSRYVMKRDVKNAGFWQGEKTVTECQCADCRKTANGLRSWWKKADYEYNEWEVYCLKCAYDAVHRLDDFDEKEFERIMNSSERVVNASTKNK